MNLDHLANFIADIHRELDLVATKAVKLQYFSREGCGRPFVLDQLERTAPDLPKPSPPFVWLKARTVSRPRRYFACACAFDCLYNVEMRNEPSLTGRSRSQRC